MTIQLRAIAADELDGSEGLRMSGNLNYLIEITGTIVFIAIALMHGQQFASVVDSSSVLFNKVVGTLQGL